MRLKSAETLLCGIIALTICQYAHSYYNNNGVYVYGNPIYTYYIPANVRISGGQYALPAQFPFMAVVHRLSGSGRIGQCGGTIISSRWVLTAAHCAVDSPRKFFVVFGTTDKSGIAYDVLWGPGVSMITNKVVIHPQYGANRNDIALLYMPRDIPFSSTIQPIKIADYPYEDFADKTAQVIGWGKDQQHSGGTKRLKYATLPIISNNQCRQYWRISNTHICTAAGLGQDACQGDSGGPLVTMENGQIVQVGIVSYGDAFCPSNKPGVFTRVSSFVQWIDSVTNAMSVE